MNKANAIATLLVYAACLILAVFIGYTLAVGRGMQDYVFVGALFLLLVLPLLLRWHYAMLLLVWNSTAGAYFLPGQFPLWVPLTGLTLVLLMLHKTLHKPEPMTNVPVLTTPMIVFGVVVMVTIFARGGLAVQWMGSGDLAGGRKYAWILSALLGYFALSLHQIPPKRAKIYFTLFTLGGVTGFIGPLSVWLGSGMEYLTLFFAPIEGVAASDEMFRVKGMAYVGLAIVTWLLGLYGFHGTFHTMRLWRPLLLVTGILLGAISGFRTFMLLYLMILATLFVLEGHHRTKYIIYWSGALLALIIFLIPVVPSLPTPVQRALSFLPVKLDTAVRAEAESTITWREGLWEELKHDLPRYFWLGKGMAITSRDMDWAETLKRFGAQQWYASYLAGEAHNGILSVTIGFGVWGFLAWAWLSLAGLWVLHRNYRHGDEELKRINAVLFALFLSWLVLFCSYAGTLYWQLRDFTGILGLSIGLNHGLAVRRLASVFTPEPAQPGGLPQPNAPSLP